MHQTTGTHRGSSIRLTANFSPGVLSNQEIPHELLVSRVFIGALSHTAHMAKLGFPDPAGGSGSYF